MSTRLNDGVQQAREAAELFRVDKINKEQFKTALDKAEISLYSMKVGIGAASNYPTNTSFYGASPPPIFEASRIESGEGVDETEHPETRAGYTPIPISSERPNMYEQAQLLRKPKASYGATTTSTPLAIRSKAALKGVNTSLPNILEEEESTNQRGGRRRIHHRIRTQKKTGKRRASTHKRRRV
jgi:hypothetical protein